MLSIKKITEKFEVSRATLHNWKTTKPKLYSCLLNSDDTSDELRECKMLLEKYSKSIKGTFALGEIEYILELGFGLDSLEEIENIHTIYSIAIAKEIKQNSAFVLGIYQKLQNLGLVEKYIFVARYKHVSAKKVKTEEKKELIRYFFKEFLA